MTADEIDEHMQGVLVGLNGALPENTAVVILLANREPEGVRMAGYSNVEPAAARGACAYGPMLFADNNTERRDQ